MRKYKRKNESIENFIDSNIHTIENNLSMAKIKCRFDLIQYYQKELEIFYKIKVFVNQINS